MNRSSLILNSNSVAESSQARGITYRRREWHRWREEYLQATPQERRGAWINTPDGAADSKKSRLGLVRDIILGGIKLQTRHYYESGTLLQVELWEEHTGAAPTAFLVRVIRVAHKIGSGEWHYVCTFCAPNDAAA